MSATMLGRGASFTDALVEIAANAEARDRLPGFPDEAIDALRAAEVTSLTANPAEPVPAGMEWAVVRAVAAADGSVARILDGHLNAVERLRVAAPEPLRTRELEGVAGGDVLLGVWGADPGPGEGEPAHLRPDGTVEGVKTFCSGAGGLDAALVLVRGDEPGPPLLAYVDLAQDVEVDRDWYRAAGMRASESHRVVFRSARVIAVLGDPGELAREPWFGRDAIRTAACWAGLCDAVRASALDALSARADDDLAALAAGRMQAARGTIDSWFDFAAGRVEAEPDAPMADLSISLRTAVAGAARTTVEQAVAALGTRPLVAGRVFDRARRDLELFLNQHRLDPLVLKMGRRALAR